MVYAATKCGIWVVVFINGEIITRYEEIGTR
jgi:hypothetical protein